MDIQVYRPNSVRNRCVIELFGGVFVLALQAFKEQKTRSFSYRIKLDLQVDRPKSVRNRCVIDFCWRLCVVNLQFYKLPVGIMAFVIGLSQICFVLSLDNRLYKIGFDSILIYNMYITMTKCHLKPILIILCSTFFVL